jgi:hypothetical protein
LHFLFKVEKIFVPEQYEGLLGNHLGDIAIVVSKKVFNFSLTVQPVCVDWTKTSDDFSNSENKIFGYINGWGYITGRTSDELRSIRVLFVSRQNCLLDIHPFVQERLTSDRICAENLNNIF